MTNLARDVPKLEKNPLRQCNINFRSLNAVQSMIELFLGGGRRSRMKGILMAWRTNTRSVIARTDQAKPIILKSCDNMMGNIMPSREEPATTIPKAMAR